MVFATKEGVYAFLMNKLNTEIPCSTYSHYLPCYFAVKGQLGGSTPRMEKDEITGRLVKHWRSTGPKTFGTFWVTTEDIKKYQAEMSKEGST